MKRTNLIFGLVMLLFIFSVNAFDPMIITTQGSSNLTTTSATLTGTLTNLLSPEADVWFQYGLSPFGPWQNSTIQNLSSNDIFSSTITGLQPDTTYYYFAIGFDGLAGDTGSTLTFTTLSDTQCKTVSNLVFDSFNIGIIAILLMAFSIVITVLMAAFGGNIDIKSMQLTIMIMILVAIMYFVGLMLFAKISGVLC